MRYLLDKSDCPYKVIGKEAQYCGGLPADPANLTASAVSGSQINLAWTDGSTNELGFKIERCTGAGCSDFAQVATVGANVTSYSNTGLARLDELQLSRARVQRRRRLGLHQHRQRHDARRLPHAGCADQPDRDGRLRSQINLTWTDNATNEDRLQDRALQGSDLHQLHTDRHRGCERDQLFEYEADGQHVLQLSRRAAYNTSGTSAYSNIATATTPRR